MPVLSTTPQHRRDDPPLQPEWRMPHVEPLTPVVVYQNFRLEHPRIGFVTKVLHGRAVDVLIATEGSLAIVRESRHLADPELERRTIRDMIERNPQRTVFDIAPTEKERRRAIASMRTFDGRLDELAGRLEALEEQMAALPKRRSPGRPRKPENEPSPSDTE